MSTVSKVNFEPFRDALPIVKADFPLADKTLADPSNSVALVDGEWMTLNSAEKLVRASTIGSVGNAADQTLCWPLWAERGRYDVQAISDRKMPLLWLGGWEFETRIYDAAATVGSGAAITAFGQGLKVATITIGSRNFTGLVGHGGSGDSHRVVAHVTRLHTNNGGKLRIRGGAYY